MAQPSRARPADGHARAVALGRSGGGAIRLFLRFTTFSSCIGAASQDRMKQIHGPPHAGPSVGGAMRQRGKAQMIKTIVTVIGMDKVGIIAKTSTLLSEFNVNILDINQDGHAGVFHHGHAGGCGRVQRVV